MIKEYYFPNIFHNIVGQIIPEYVLERMNRPDLIRQIKSRNGSYQNSIKFSSDSDSPSVGFGSFGPKIKKKKIFTRNQQFNHTNFLISARQQQIDKETIKSEQTSQLKSFLRKKQGNLTEMTPSQEREKAQESQAVSQESEITIKVSFTDIEVQQIMYKQKQRKTKRAHFRMRTSIDRPVELTGISEQGEEDLLQTIKRRSENDVDKANRGSNNQTQRVSPFNSERAGQFSKLSIQRQNSLGKMSMVSKLATNRTLIDKAERKNVKKKTVNFANSKSSLGSDQTRFIREASRKETVYSNMSKISKKSSKKKVNHKLTRFKPEDNISDVSSLKTISIGTGMSVISIKINQSAQGSVYTRQKSLRSNQSILKTQRNMMYKNTLNRTRTARFINNQEFLAIDKPFKSQKSIKNQKESVSLNKKDKEFILKRSKGSKKSTQGSQKKFKVKKAVISRASIIGKGDMFQYNDASINRLLIGQGCNPLSDLLARRQNPRALNKTALRQTVEEDNVYDELNDFLKFFHDKENIETQMQLKKTLNKPIVLADQTKIRQIGNNKQSFERQNQCIDMGIKLVKRMNRLAQKKY